MLKINKNILQRSNTPFQGKKLKSSNPHFSTSKSSTRPLPAGVKSNKAINNSERNGIVKQFKVVNKKVNNCIAILSQKRIDSSIVAKKQKVDTLLDQASRSLDLLDSLLNDHVMKDKPKGKSVLREKLVKSGKFTEEEATDFINKS